MLNPFLILLDFNPNLGYNTHMKIQTTNIPSSGSFDFLTHSVDWERLAKNEIKLTIGMYFDESGNDLEVHMLFLKPVIESAADYELSCSEILMGDGDAADLDSDYGDDIAEAFMEHLSTVILL